MLRKNTIGIFSLWMSVYKLFVEAIAFDLIESHSDQGILIGRKIRFFLPRVLIDLLVKKQENVFSSHREAEK